MSCSLSGGCVFQTLDWFKSRGIFHNMFIQQNSSNNLVNLGLAKQTSVSKNCKTV